MNAFLSKKTTVSTGLMFFIFGMLLANWGKNSSAIIYTGRTIEITSGLLMIVAGYRSGLLPLRSILIYLSIALAFLLLGQLL